MKPMIFEITLSEEKHEPLATAMENHAADHVDLNEDRRSGHVKNPSDKSEFDFKVLKGGKVRITVTVNPLKWTAAQFEARILERAKELMELDEE